MTPKADNDLTTIRPRLRDRAYLEGEKGCTIFLVARSGKGALEGDTYGVFLVLTRRGRRPGEDPKGTNPSGGIGRRAGLKIRWCESTVSVRARPPVLANPLQNSKNVGEQSEAPDYGTGGCGSSRAAVGYESASSIALAALSCMSGRAWE